MTHIFINTYKRQTKIFIKFGNIEIEKRKFRDWKELIFLEEVDTDTLLESFKVLR